MKDKEWLKDEVARIYDTRDYWSVDDLRDEILDSINELDEPEKVVVPEFVAEWYEVNKDDLDYKIFESITEINELNSKDFKEIHDWFNQGKWNGKIHYPIETVIKMKLFGYEVEKEPLFYIPLGVVRSDGNEFYLAKTSLDVIGIDSSSERYVKDKWNAHYYRFTEQEIKDYDERFWSFAVPVEVEKEPLYYVVDKNDRVLWYRNLDGEPEISGASLKGVQKSISKKRYQFTEQEIKDFDERFWAFAVPVEAVE